MKKALLVDFDDSFTFNLLQELSLLGLEVTLINWKDFDTLPYEGLLVLGPGPGHPDDYQAIFPLLREWVGQKKAFFGVCLGHQVFWRLLGEDVLRSKAPVHGQRVELFLNASWKEWLGLKGRIWVQRYNSLAVLESSRLRHPFLLNHVQDDEILITRGDNLMTYQFHPESVGTSFRSRFLAPVLRDLIY
jgi:anthranilate/para-aminobenzoate synthase component II